MGKLTLTARSKIKGSKSATPTKKRRTVSAAEDGAEPGSSGGGGASGGVSGGGVAKKKHALGAKREHALLPKLKEAEASGKADVAVAKAKRKRAANSTVLGAVDGMRASLEELLAEGEARAAKSQAEDYSIGLNAKKRLKLVAEETANLADVIAHPAFKADPFAALSAHLNATVDQQHVSESHTPRASLPQLRPSLNANAPVSSARRPSRVHYKVGDNHTPARLCSLTRTRPSLKGALCTCVMSVGLARFIYVSIYIYICVSRSRPHATPGVCLDFGGSELQKLDCVLTHPSPTESGAPLLNLFSLIY